MSILLGCDLEGMNAAGKTAALLAHGIALSDVILSCEIHRSSDASIKNVKCTDIPELLASSKVKRILLNGNKAYDLFLRHFPEYEKIARKMPSTSPANARMTLSDLIEAWKAELN